MEGETTIPRVSRMEARLSQILLSDLSPEHEDVITVPSHYSIEQTLRILNEHHILSAPVMVDGSVIGMIDMLDVVAFFVQEYRRGLISVVETLNEEQLQENLKTIDVQALTNGGQSLKASVDKIFDMSERNPVCPVDHKGTLYQLMEVFAKGVHRVPLVDSNGRLCGVLSQSRVIRFLYENPKTLAPTFSRMTMQDLWVDTKNVITINHKRQAIYALFVMMEYKVSAVAVVDDEGRFVANLSGSDLKGLTEECFGWLICSVIDFLKQMNGTIRLPITCTATTTIAAAIAQLATSNIHRLWMVDGSGRPIGVLSMTDIFHHIVGFIDA
eukprot:TRINITY_DN5150_c0_g1_i1.p1 TRINITY_DN5150_c0_g1~~TRINITY_DN5150_c0_g1_i1.p1  ORF type:complete len:327 (+),score=68.45 TRINITY_DN5150_c0_g1_i1:106-1086(+)